MLREPGSVPINDMQCRPLKSALGFLFQKDAQCYETNEKTILQFLVFEIWSILY